MTGDGSTMIAERRKNDRRAWWMRAYQSVITTVIAAVIVLGVQTLANLDKSVAAITPRLDSIDMQVAGAYRASEARVVISSLQRQIEHGDAKDADHDRKLDDLDHRVDAIERRHGTAAAQAAKRAKP